MIIARVVSTVTLLVSLVGLFACEDEEFTTTVSGRVVNFGSGEPIEGVTVYLKDGVGASGFSININTSSDLRNETLTDENGEFVVSLTGTHSASLSMGKEGYQFDPDWNDGISIGVRGYGRGGGAYQDQLFKLKAEARFSPIFQSIVPVEKNDSLVLTAPLRWVKTCVGKEVCHFFHSIPLLTTGDQYTRYQIDYKRNGVKQTRIDSVYIKSFEVFADTIYY